VPVGSAEPSVMSARQLSHHRRTLANEWDKDGYSSVAKLSVAPGEQGSGGSHERS
jgi:hypothetical protein